MTTIDEKIKQLKDRLKKSNLCTASDNPPFFCGNRLPCPIHGGEPQNTIPEETLIGISQDLFREIRFDETHLCSECGRKLSGEKSWLELARIYDEVGNSLSVNMLDTDLMQQARKRAAYAYSMAMREIWVVEEVNDPDPDDDEDDENVE